MSRASLSPGERERHRKAWGGWPHPEPDPDRDPRRCRCPECLAEDARRPQDGYQLGLPLK